MPSRRRRRRAVATSAAAVLLVAVAGTGFALLNNGNGPLDTTVADHTPTGTTQPTDLERPHDLGHPDPLLRYGARPARRGTAPSRSR